MKKDEEIVLEASEDVGAEEETQNGLCFLFMFVIQKTNS
jgi:hypothetical protein